MVTATRGRMVLLLTGAEHWSAMPRFSPKAVAAGQVQQRLTIVPMVPAMLDVISFGGGCDMRSLRCVLEAGAILVLPPVARRNNFRPANRAPQRRSPCALVWKSRPETGGISVATGGSGRARSMACAGPPMAGIDVAIRRDADASQDRLTIPVASW